MENFSDCGLEPHILRAIEKLGFEQPTPVQAQTIPIILKQEQDLIALARTGTGKTGGFGLPLVQTVQKEGGVQALILCPTRELCLQIARDIKDFAKFTKGIWCVAVYGGASIGDQIRALENGAQIVVGTPGRTLDLIKRKKLKVESLGQLVLDEADEMLNMGFQEELDAILEATPSEKRTYLFSATMPKEARQMADKYMDNPFELSLGHQDAGNSKVVHRFYQVKSADRFRLLSMLIALEPEIYGVVFCRTRREVDNIAEDLRSSGLVTAAIHGDLSQAQRDEVMGRFRSKKIRVLVATDVAARGLDVQDLTHVINYQMPDSPEVYVHRSGRTGRAGKEGISLAIINGREKRKIQAVEKHTGITFEQGELPKAEEVYKTRVMAYANRVLGHQSEDEQLSKVIRSEVLDLFKGMGRAELIEQFTSLALTDLSERFAKQGELQSVSSSAKESYGKDKNVDYTRFCIRMGRKNGLSTSQLIGMLNRKVPGKKVAIGKVDIQANLSFFDVDSRSADLVEQSLQGVVDKGTALNIQRYGAGERGSKSRTAYKGFKKKVKFKGARKQKGKKGLKKAKW
ncbi:MAG: DEAD/DEAH box helicase [Bacteroidota bacterium]